MSKPEPREPLDYRGPAPGQRPPNMALQLVVGCLAAAALIGVAAFFAGYVAFGFIEDRSALAMIVFAGIMCGAIGTIVVGALRARRDPRRRVLQIGLWLGLGVGLLIAGLCFSAVLAI